MGGMQFRGSTCREGHGGTTAVSIGRDDCRISGGVMGLLQGDLPPGPPFSEARDSRPDPRLAIRGSHVLNSGFTASCHVC
jgi:hypothetical protein